MSGKQRWVYVLIHLALFGVAGLLFWEQIRLLLVVLYAYFAYVTGL